MRSDFSLNEIYFLQQQLKLTFVFAAYKYDVA